MYGRSRLWESYPPVNIVLTSRHAPISTARPLELSHMEWLRDEATVIDVRGCTCCAEPTPIGDLSNDRWCTRATVLHDHARQRCIMIDWCFKHVRIWPLELCAEGPPPQSSDDDPNCAIKHVPMEWFESDNARCSARKPETQLGKRDRNVCNIWQQAMCIDPNGNICVGYRLWTHDQAYIVILDPDGNLLAQMELHEGLDIRGMAVDENGDLAVCCTRSTRGDCTASVGRVCVGN